MTEPLLNVRTAALAKMLAERRGLTPAQAIVFAREAEIARDNAHLRLSQQVDAIMKELMEERKRTDRIMTRDEIDAMWEMC